MAGPRLLIVALAFIAFLAFVAISIALITWDRAPLASPAADHM